MNKIFLLLISCLVLLLNSCANEIYPEDEDRGPASFSPDPISHVPDPEAGRDPLAGRGRY